jgi:hypothetical protein
MANEFSEVALFACIAWQAAITPSYFIPLLIRRARSALTRPNCTPRSEEAATAFASNGLVDPQHMHSIRMLFFDLFSFGKVMPTMEVVSSSITPRLELGLNGARICH